MIKMTDFELLSEDSEHEGGEAKEERYNPPQCQKILSKLKQTLIDHYKSFHKYVPNDHRDEEITIVTKRVMPVKKDGTCSTDKDAMAYTRIHCKVCKFCN